MSSSPVWQRWEGSAGALAVHDVIAAGTAGAQRGLVVVSHGLPSDKAPAGFIPSSLVALSDRIASETGWRVVACCLRGVEPSEGDFSLEGWLDDLRRVKDKAVVDTAIANGDEHPPDPLEHPAGDLGAGDLGTGGVGPWLVGIGTSGALAMRLAATDQTVRGVACLSAPATFSEWADDPAGIAVHAREVGVLSTPGAPPDLAAWARPFREVQPLADARRLRGRPVLVMHGAEDDLVPVEHAREIAEAVGDSAELRILAGASNRLNSDPRAVALLLGWLDRQRL